MGRCNLAMMHVRRQAAQSSLNKALELLETSAAQGFVRSEHSLGEIYERGLAGMPDHARSVQWYIKAAEHGHMEAQVAAGTAYYLDRGVPQDWAQAAEWYRRAALKGEMGAQYLLASTYEKGLGVPRDARLARYWYQAAAANGDEAAPYKVKEMDEVLQGPGAVIVTFASILKLIPLPASAPCSCHRSASQARKTDCQRSSV